jgi:hypothetical protein
VICTRLEGGIGNQLFQYAAGRALALNHGTELLLDTSALSAQLKGVTPRNFELNHFDIGARVAKFDECLVPLWLRHIPALSHWISPWRMHVERGCNFNPRFVSLPDDTYLVGYWQSYRYFDEIADQLTDDLKIVAPLSAASTTIAKQIESSMSVAIHVRRGDYVSLASASNLHGTLSLDYYINAIRELGKSLHGARYFVFSDDPDWCQVNLPLDETAVYVTHNAGADSWQDLMLMARCQHHIIANSSFSWWGAWLADQQHPAGIDHLVYAPRRWFTAQSGLELRDRFPPHWLVR